MLGNRGPVDNPPPIIGVIPLRLGAGLTLMYMHAWQHAGLAWQHVWNQQPWDMIATMEKAGLGPTMGKLLAATAALVAVFTAASWILGFVTRFSSAIFLLVALGSLWVCNRVGDSIGAEASILYFLIALTLVVNGSGWLAIDTLFEMRRNRKSDSLYV